MPVLKYPNTLLKKVCEPVTTFDSNLVDILKKMEEELVVEGGAALAANQVGIIKRIFVTSSQYGIDIPRWFINPEIIRQDELTRCTEGCLSIPGIKAWTNRYNKITVKFQDETGLERTYAAEGFYAVVCQHEIDHLNGKLFIEDLSPIELTRISAKLNKLRTRK